MSLFTRLYDLMKKAHNNPKEDYLSEIFTEVLKTPYVLQDFICRFAKICLYDISNIKVESQKTYKKLEHHDTDSRPDIVIQFKNRITEQQYTIFIESKLSSVEGEKQLQRYAEHLDIVRKYSKTYLIYITEFFDPKDEKDIFTNGKTSGFSQLRWHEVYTWLKEFENRDSMIRACLEYMGDIGMNKGRFFLPQDIYAIQNSSRLFGMMDEILDGDIDLYLNNSFGKPSQKNTRFTQLREYDRYIKYTELNNGLMYIWVGFELTEDIYPLCCTTLKISPKNSQRKEIFDGINDFVTKNPEFKSQDIGDEGEWGFLYRQKPLLDFMGSEDHIKEIEKYFLEGLQLLKAFKDNHPKINW